MLEWHIQLGMQHAYSIFLKVRHDRDYHIVSPHLLPLCDFLDHALIINISPCIS